MEVMAMPNKLKPEVDQWYRHTDKGQRFSVIAFEPDEDTVEVQHFDGDLEEFSLDEWYDLDIEKSEEPENWSGAFDIGEADDLGTEITDTTQDDWTEPFEEIHSPKRRR
jgi:hypothetical protein